jgi:hypothetical protein
MGISRGIRSGRYSNANDYGFYGDYDAVVVECSWISEKNSGKKESLEKKREKDSSGNTKKPAKRKVRVRINGIHSPDATKLPNNKLPWAEITAPASSGSGFLFTGHIAQISPGDSVIIRFRNGNRTKPVVTGVKSRTFYENSYGEFDPKNALNSFSPTLNVVIPNYGFEGNSVYNFNAVEYSVTENFHSNIQPFETDLAIPCAGEVEDATEVKTALSNAIKEIENFRKNAAQFAQNRLQFVGEVQLKIDKYAEIVSGWISAKIKWLQEEILKRINAASVSTANALSLNSRFPIREGQSILVQAIYCLFNKILDKITDAIVNLLKDLIDRFIIVPLCAIENLLQSILSKILGLLTSVLGSIASLIGAVAGIVDQVLGFVIDLLSIFDCEPPKKCPDVNKWNLLEGAGDNAEGFELDINSILKQAESFAQQVTDITKLVYDPDTGELLGVDIDDFSFDLNDVLSDLSCEGTPLLCGPPKITFFGGNGSGAAGNTIISSAGELLGVDITNTGSGYSDTPFASIVDECGKGSGAVVKPKIGIIPPELEFIATPLSGGAVQLKWKTKRAKVVETNFGSTELSGTTSVTPTQDTKYTVKAIGKYGQYRQKSLLVRVNNNAIEYDPDIFTTIDPDNINPPIDSEIDNGSGDNGGGDNGSDGGGNGGSDGSGDNGGGDNGGGSGECPPLKPFISTRRPPIEIDPEDLGVVSVLVVEPGYEYLATPDGSLGGEGRTWANPEDTIVRRKDGKYDLPYPPNSVVQLNQCDYVNPPGEDPFRPDEDTEYITPEPPLGYDTITRGISPSFENGDYGVVLYICEVEILNAGGAYSPTDTITVTPDNGAQLQPTFDKNGSLIKVNIISSGSGFLEFPSITVNSKTGFNAQLIPKLCVERVGDLLEDDVNRYSGQQIISVIDCVGRN